MDPPAPAPAPARRRDVLFFRTPQLWRTWPFLPVVRVSATGERECGVLFDCVGAGGPCGYSATVFRANLFLLPRSLAEFLALPRETFDTPEEVADAGWTVD